MSNKIVKINKEVKIDDTLTTEELDKVVETLEENRDTEFDDTLEESKDIVYDKIEEMNNNSEIFTSTMKGLGVSDETIESLKDVSVDVSNIKEISENEKNYTGVFKDYGINSKDAAILMNVIIKYKNDKDISTLYDSCPKTVRDMVDGLRATVDTKISKNKATELIINEFINDAKFECAIDEYNAEVNGLLEETSTEFKKMITGHIDEIINSIDEISEKDPEKAESLRKIKQSFDDATSFKRVLEYVDKIPPKKLEKLVSRYNDECFYFNKRINNTEIKLQDIRNIYPVIKKALDGFTEKQIKKFIIVLCKSTYELDLNKVEDLAYMYRLVDNILTYIYTDDFSSEDAKNMFEGISVVIRKIIDQEV